MVRHTNLAGDAAALALSEPGRPQRERAMRALRLLEVGRAVLLSQALDTRSDLTDLRSAHPALATEFAQLRDQLTRLPVAATGGGGALASAPRPARGQVR